MLVNSLGVLGDLLSLATVLVQLTLDLLAHIDLIAKLHVPNLLALQVQVVVMFDRELIQPYAGRLPHKHALQLNVHARINADHFAGQLQVVLQLEIAPFTDQALQKADQRLAGDRLLLRFLHFDLTCEAFSTLLPIIDHRLFLL